VNSMFHARLSRVWRLTRLVAWSSLIAWVIATSAVTAGAWLVHLNTHSSGGVAERPLRVILTVLWLPAHLSERVFRMASSPFHSPEDVVSNIVAYLHETFFAVLVIILVGLFARNLSVGFRARLTSRRQPTEERADAAR